MIPTSGGLIFLDGFLMMGPMMRRYQSDGVYRGALAAKENGQIRRPFVGRH